MIKSKLIAGFRMRHITLEAGIAMHEDEQRDKLAEEEKTEWDGNGSPSEVQLPNSQATLIHFARKYHFASQSSRLRTINYRVWQRVFPTRDARVTFRDAPLLY